MTLPSFARFYEAVHDGRQPFPWQIRLSDEVLERGWSGLLLDLPTGTGKTSALEVALYCLARAPERMPRRTLLVVDRRIVVDQGADHARKLQGTLEQATSGPAREIADALRRLPGAAEAEPDVPCFDVAVMRGGMPRDNDWARRPDRPVLGVSTVDQVGSRLLFRGYGLSPLGAPIHAGLLGNDTLILLDEVHLAVPFAQTLDMIRARYRKPGNGLPDRFAVVRMSATAGVALAAERTFTLDAKDEQDPVLARRLAASKRAKLVVLKGTGDDEPANRLMVARRAVDEALTLQRDGARTIGVVVNRVDTARLALELLREHANATDSILVTGRMRPIDRDRVVRRELVRAMSGRTRTAEDRHLVVVATQCIEAGADLDFDGLVTECASLDALRQRFGRVDRRGELKATRSVIVAREDQLGDDANDPVYGAALAATWKWLSSVAVKGEVDFGIKALPPALDSKRRPLAEVIAESANAPVMLPAHIDAWAQTSIPPVPDPDVALWLHGPEREAADVQIVWRALDGLGGLEHFDVDAISPADRRLSALLERLSAVRPSTLEAITVPISAARRWFAGELPESIADVVAAQEMTEDRGRRSIDNREVVALRWAGDDSDVVCASMVRPGDVLVVDASRGGLANDSFAPESTTPVVDVGDLAQLRGRAHATLRLSTAALASWHPGADLVSSVPVLAEDESLHDLTARVREWVGNWPRQPSERFHGTELEWSAARDALASKRSRLVRTDGEVVFTAPVNRSLLRTEIADAITEDDDSSFRAAEVTLTQHSVDVRTLAEHYARSLGLSTELIDDIALAGWLHDVGKADPRFQRWLVGGDEIRLATTDLLLAKSALPPGNAHQRRLARERAGYPDGYRHELLSLAMVEENQELLGRMRDPDLVLHLVASHHGWCRPFAKPLDDPEDIAVALKHDSVSLAATTRHRRAALDSGVADRYWTLTERYGWWGLAWLEAILRLADHRASESAESAG